MTKEKLWRLMELSEIRVSPEAGEEWDCLRAEFEAWKPEIAEISRADANHFEQEAVNARAVAQEYYTDLRQEVGDYMWEKHYAHDPQQPDRRWLKPPPHWNGKEWAAGSEAGMKESNP